MRKPFLHVTERMIKLSIEIKRSDKYVDYNISATNNRGYITIDTSDWINKPWMFYELPALKFEIYTETNGELVKYQNFTREIRTYNPVYSPLGVLNVTIDIRNVPEEFILRITPIFDNDAIDARNMLIENGIENGDIWGSDQDVPTQLFNLDLEFIECDGEYVPPTPPVPPTHEETITGIPPITFDGSTGEPLVSWTILGNGQQTGTPSPDNIIMPEFVGVRTANLFDNQSLANGYINSSGNVASAGSTKHTDYIPVDAGSTYTLTTEIKIGIGHYLAIYNAEKSKIGNTVDMRNLTTVTVNIPENGAFVRFSMQSGDITKNTMFNKGSAIPYEPYGWKIPLTCAGQTVPVYLGQVSTVRRIKKLIFTGDESWNYSTQGNNTRAYTPQIAECLSLSPAICTHFAYNVANVGYPRKDEFVINSSKAIIFGIDGSVFTDKTAWTTYLQQQYAAGTPVTVWYVLAEPETTTVNEPLAKIGDYADELSSADAGVTIPTTEGQNTLTVDTDLQPSEMTITYIKEGQ